MKDKDTSKDKQSPEEALQDEAAQTPPADAQAADGSLESTATSADKPADDSVASTESATSSGDAESSSDKTADKSEDKTTGDDAEIVSGELVAATGETADGDAAEPPASEAAPAEEPRKGGRAALIVAVLALIIALLGLGGGYYLYEQSLKQQQSLADSDAAWRSTADKLAAGTRAAQSAAEARAAAVGAEARQAREAMLAQIAEYDGRLVGLTESLAQTQEYALRSQRGWLLAEVDYLLRIAIQRVLLAGDMDSAAAALRAADSRLHELGDVNYLDVRQRLADEVAALRGADRPDVEGTVFELVRLGRRADELPLMGVLAFAERESDAQSEAIDVMPEGAFWDAVQNFIVVRRNDVEVDLSVSPSREQMSRAETLRLQLQAAQLAAMRRDQGGFASYMEQALAYVKKEYEQEDPKVQRFVEDLDLMAQRQIVPQIGSLGEALQLFKDTNAKYAEPRPDLENVSTVAVEAVEAPEIAEETTGEEAQ